MTTFANSRTTGGTRKSQAEEDTYTITTGINIFDQIDTTVCDGVIDSGYLAYLDEIVCGVAVYCCYHNSVKTTRLLSMGKYVSQMFGLEVDRQLVTP